jgi:ketosteroid isomerase-like protein
MSVVFLLLAGAKMLSQIVAPNASAANPSPPPLISTEPEVRQFFDEYVERYTKMDLDEFLLLFSVKAKQNQKDGLPEIRMIYSDLFNRSKSLQLSTEDMKIEIYQDAVEMKARYTVDQVLKKGGEKRAWKGDLRWVLAKEEGNLKIVSIEYRHSIPPTVVTERERTAKEESAKKAVVKLETPRLVLARADELKQFFANYLERYRLKDIDGFLSLFSTRAVQNQKDGWKGIKKIYTKFFDQSQVLEYQLEDRSIEIYQNVAEVKARFRVDQTLKKGGEEKVWSGPIRWVLGREDGVLKIISLDYQNDKTPLKKEEAEKEREN